MDLFLGAASKAHCVMDGLVCYWYVLYAITRTSLVYQYRV